MVRVNLRFTLCFLCRQQQRLVKTSNGVDGVLVVEKKADTIENGNITEDKLSEEPENETLSPFSLPGEGLIRSHINTFGL